MLAKGVERKSQEIRLGRTAICSTSSRTWDRRMSSGRAVYQISHNADGGFCAYGVAVGAQFDGDPIL